MNESKYIATAFIQVLFKLRLVISERMGEGKAWFGGGEYEVIVNKNSGVS